jgi:4-hydroxyacetophenone monooxygenase
MVRWREAPPGYPSALRSALAEANIPTLLMVLRQLTGETAWLDEPYRPKRAHGLDDNDSAGLPPELQVTVREAAFDAVMAFRRGELSPAVLRPCDLTRMLSVCIADEVPDSYGPLLAEEMGIKSRHLPAPLSPPDSDFSVLVVGSGVSGLNAAIALQKAGIKYVMIEKNDSIGGAWLENVYPGCGVDTPSSLYSFSYAQNTSWSKYFAKRNEISAYLEGLADDHRVRENIIFDTEVVSAEYDSDANRWAVAVRSAAGERTLYCTVLISAVGVLNRPSIPPIPGLSEFAGPTMHTAQWNTDVDLTNKRVAVVGTGASAMQLVPAIANEAERVTVFQRSKQWAVPNPNYKREISSSVRLVMSEVPFYAEWYRLRAFWNFSDKLHPQLQIDPDWRDTERSINAANEKHRVFLTKYIESELGERTDLVEACVPDYPPYGKRPLIDNGWFRTICRSNVDLVTEGVVKVLPQSLVSASGEEYFADVIVMATGFRSLQFLWPMEIRGRSGKALTEVWGADDARAYLGISVPDFPNFFILNGPNTTAGHGGSAILSIEFQMRHIMQAILLLSSDSTASIEVKPEVFEAYNAELDEALARSVWAHPGMTSYYRNDAGRIVVTSPWSYLDYWQRTLTLDRGAYLLRTANAGVAR